MTEETPRRRFSPGVVIAIFVVVAIVVLIAVFFRPLADFFGNPDRIQQIVTDAGPWGPVVFIGLQVAQVFFAPIPGQVTGFAGGYLFGIWLGTLYSMIGAAIGFTIIFVLAKKLGRPFVERFVKPEHLDRFDYIAKRGGPLILLIIFLLPLFPDDIISFIAGLSPIPIPTLLLVSLAGRLPGFFLLSMTGAGTQEGNWGLIIGIAIPIAILLLVALWKRKEITAYVRDLARPPDPPAGPAGQPPA